MVPSSLPERLCASLEGVFNRGPVRWVLLLAVGLMTRLPPVLAADFPLNDGAPFALAIRSLAQNHFLLPPTLPFNGFQIPFAYPPLGFYLGALTTKIFGLDPVSVVRWLPLVISEFTVPAVALLTERLTRDQRLGLLAGLMYAVIPRSYLWLILGGGLTRSLGVLAALVALAALAPCFTEEKMSPRMSVVAALATAASAVSHPEAPIYLLVAAASLWLAGDRRPYSLKHLTMTAAFGVLLTIPWSVTVVLRHGVRPFLAAAQTSTWSFDPWTILNPLHLGAVTGELWFGPLALLVGLGLAVCVALGNLSAPLWLVLILLADRRSGATFAAVPAAILVAASLKHALFEPFRTKLKRPAYGVFVVAVTSLILAAALQENLAVWRAPRQAAHALTRGQRDVMCWIDRSTPKDARFLVLTDVSGWWVDRYAEWFPVLANRRSVTTVQMTEWLAGGVFEKRVRLREVSLRKAHQGPVDFGRWLEQSMPEVSHIVVMGPALHDRRLLTTLGKMRGMGTISLVHQDSAGLVFAVGRATQVPRDDSNGDGSEH